MPTTALGIRYPVLSDTANVPRDIGYTAADVNGLLTTAATAVASQTAILGTTPPAGTLMRRRSWKVTMTTDANGDYWAALPQAAPNGITGIHVQALQNANVMFFIVTAGSSLNTIQIHTYFCATAANYASSNMDVSITVEYW